MKISVIVPVYNVEPSLLKPCLEALEAQTLREEEYEIVIVDDCSTDDATIAMITEFAASVSNASIVRHSSNRGLNRARQSGVRNAAGEYVIFVDGDDILTRDAIETLQISACRSNAEIVTAPFFRWNNANKSYVVLTKTDQPFSVDYIRRLRETVSGEYLFTMCGRLFRRTILTDEIFDLPDGQLHEDVTTFVRIAFNVGIVSHVKKPIYYYTINPNSITNNFSDAHVNGMFAAIEDWIKRAKEKKLFGDINAVMALGVEKMVNICLERCIYSENLQESEKVHICERIRRWYRALPLPYVEPKLDGTKFLYQFEYEDIAEHPFRFLDLVHREFLYGVASAPDPHRLFDGGLGPSDMARRLKDKVVFIGQVDYQVRNAAIVARELRLRGHPCAVLDNSAFAAGGARQLRPDERGIFWRTEHIRVDEPPYGADWLATAKLVIVFNDFNDDFREALEYRHRLGLPTACAVEGINDFLRQDFDSYRFLPYRRCDHVFLAGENDRQYFGDRKTYVAGMPIIEKLSSKSPVFPPQHLAILNVNFTYGALEYERDRFVEKAKAAFERVAVDWVITQHPMDDGALKHLPVSSKTQYELIDQGSVFVSRFATGILEALASGKPAIYFNPHGEKVAKFKDPMGAFKIARDEDELTQALIDVFADIEDGVDFRERALPFLKHHTGYDPKGGASHELFADAVIEVLDGANEAMVENAQLFFDRLKHVRLYKDVRSSDVIFGEFDRDNRAQLNEEELIGRYFGKRAGLMIDVGANFGNSLDIYLGKGWTVHAFEPDPNNRKKLLESWPDCARLTVNEEAVSNRAGDKVPFFASDESTGISGLSAFTEGHRKIGEVSTITLRDYYQQQKFKHVDFLKIDVEGFDKFVLDGFPWDKDKPDVVLAEFEDDKTVPLGYNTHDLARVMLDQGYTLYVSEWMPIIRYGIAHDWRQFMHYSHDLDLAGTWGNIIGFLKPPEEEMLRRLVMQSMKFAASRPSSAAHSVTLAPKPKLQPAR